MTERSVVYAAAVAAPTSGALCALGWLAMEDLDRVLGGRSASPVLELLSLIPVWLLAAALYGIPAGLLLGIVPTIVGVMAWGTLQRTLGTRRACGALGVLVALVGVAELSAPDVSAEDAPWLVGVAVVCGLTSAGTLWLFSLGSAR